jgi:hypothetical protein
VSIRPTLFSGPFLDRRAELRDDPAWIAAARADPATRYAIAAGPRQLVTAEAAADVVLLDASHALVSGAPAHSLTLLGWFRGQRTVLVEYAHDAGSATELPLPEATQLSELRARSSCGVRGIDSAACAEPSTNRCARATSCAARARIAARKPSRGSIPRSSCS